MRIKKYVLFHFAGGAKDDVGRGKKKERRI
jgi:hypothetical protein